MENDANDANDGIFSYFFSCYRFGPPATGPVNQEPENSVTTVTSVTTLSEGYPSGVPVRVQGLDSPFELLS